MGANDYLGAIENTIWSTDLTWVDDSYVKVIQASKISVRICANEAGLLSLANHLIKLANDNKQSIIYESWPGDLEEGSLALEIQKTQDKGRFSVLSDNSHSD